MQNDQEDWDLLRAYVRTGSESAFETLVRRYVDPVYAMAMRQTQDAHLAHDVTQAVFLVLVRKARSIRAGTILPGWFFTTTRYVAQTVLRTERRRLQRELSAMKDFAVIGSTSDANWEQLSPHIDDALASLRERDRDILLLRFFQRRTVRDVGQVLGMSEDAVQKRTTRAVEKLRHYFADRGIGVAGVTLLAGFTANASQAAPATLVPAVLDAAATPGVAGASVLAAAQAAVQMSMVSKLMMPAMAGLVLLALLPIGGAVLLPRSRAPGSVVFDLSNDFSLRANPNGAWSYGAKETIDGPMAYSSFRQLTALDEEAWAFARGRWPVVFRNPTSNTLYSANGRFDPGTVWFAAGEDRTTRNYGVIRLTVPPDLAGKYRLETLVASGLDGAAASDADFHVAHNGVEVFAREMGAGSQAGYTNEMTLLAGHTVDLLVGRGADGRQRGSVLKIQATFSLLP